MSAALDQLELECLRHVARKVEVLLAYLGEVHPAILEDRFVEELSAHMVAWSVIDANQRGGTNPVVTCGAVYPYMRQRACSLPDGHEGDVHSDGERQWGGPSMDPPRQRLLK